MLKKKRRGKDEKDNKKQRSHERHYNCKHYHFYASVCHLRSNNSSTNTIRDKKNKKGERKMDRNENYYEDEKEITRQYYAVTNADNYIKIEGATTQEKALEVLRDENYERPEWGIKMLAYADSGKRGYGLCFCLNTKNKIPARLRPW